MLTLFTHFFSFSIKENARLCGHHNAKQKIQQHMQLKKELSAQEVLLKEQSDRIVQLTLELETTKGELREAKAVNNGDAFVGHEPSSSKCSTGQHNNKRVALQDRTNKLMHGTTDYEENGTAVACVRRVTRSGAASQNTFL